MSIIDPCSPTSGYKIDPPDTDGKLSLSDYYAIEIRE
jgi:hypothetical protein